MRLLAGSKAVRTLEIAEILVERGAEIDIAEEVGWEEEARLIATTIGFGSSGRR